MQCIRTALQPTGPNRLGFVVNAAVKHAVILCEMADLSAAQSCLDAGKRAPTTSAWPPADCALFLLLLLGSIGDSWEIVGLFSRGRRRPGGTDGSAPAGLRGGLTQCPVAVLHPVPSFSALTLVRAWNCVHTQVSKALDGVAAVGAA